MVPAVAQLLAEGEAFLQAGGRVPVAADLPIDAAELGRAGGLLVAVARLAAEGEGFPQAGQRLRVAPQPLVGIAEVVEGLGLGLGCPVAGVAGKRKRGLVGLDAVVPVAVRLEQGPTRRG